MAASNTSGGKKPADLNRPLAIIVIAMGLALVGGMVLLVSKIAGEGGVEKQAGCDPSIYVVQQNESAQVVSVDHRHATLAVTTGGKAKTLRTIDMCTGDVVRELQIRPAMLESL